MPAMRGPNPPRTRRARDLRLNPTDVERRLWHRLSARQLGGHKFIRQMAVGPYFADFACREKKLIVELDGGQHAVSPTDEIRTASLEAQGYRVIRFWNNEVNEHIDGVLERILQALEN